MGQHGRCEYGNGKSSALQSADAGAEHMRLLSQLMICRRKTRTTSSTFVIQMASREQTSCSAPRSSLANYSGCPANSFHFERLVPSGSFQSTIRGFRQHHIVFLHGVTQRALRCSLANLTVNWFESEPNPPNGSVLVMRRNSGRDSGQRWSEQW